MVRIFIILLATICAVLSFRAIDAKAQSAEKQHSAPAPESASGATAIIESAAHVQPRPLNYKFPNGQNLIYSGEWRMFIAGTATLHVENSGQEARIVITADANGTGAWLYH